MKSIRPMFLRWVDPAAYAARCPENAGHTSSSCRDEAGHPILQQRLSVHRRTSRVWARSPTRRESGTVGRQKMTDDGESPTQHMLDWLRSPDGTRGIRFAESGDDWNFVGYDELAHQARQFAFVLEQRGAGVGDTVVLLHPSRQWFGAALFAAVIIGATPIPVAPPTAFQDAALFETHLANIVRISSPRAVVTTEALAPMVVRCGAGHDAVLTTTPSNDGPTLPVPAAPPGELAMLQFTSGSSGMPRGVEVTISNLESNVDAIRRWLSMTPADPTASWLPLYHDMGLIGCYLTPIINGSDLWSMLPEDFIRSPARWLRCFGVHGCRLTAAPTFGLAYVTRRVLPDQLEGLDFSQWRALIVGAERVDPEVLDGFSELLAPAGFDPRALLPAYGLAESTLAVTGSRLDELAHRRGVGRRSLVFGSSVGTLDRGDAGEGSTLVGCGRPLGQAGVEIVDEAGDVVDTSVLGEIVVTGPSVARGYVRGSSSSSSTSFGVGRLHTGDAGFVDGDGELYVVGRVGDSVKVRGVSLFAEDVEAALGLEANVPPDRVAVLLGVLDGYETVAVLVEAGPKIALQPIVDTATRLAFGARLLVLYCGRGEIARTSSGKPRRRPMWLELLQGGTKLPVEFDSKPPSTEVIAVEGGPA